MILSHRFSGVCACVLVFVLAGANRAVAADPATADVEFFESNVRPILADHCLKCHGQAKQEGGLRLDSRDAAIKGGDSGTVIEPGKPDESVLVEAIRYMGDLKMPPKAKLADDQIQILAEWVKRGAPWPAEKTGAAKLAEFNLADRKAKQWVFQPLRREPPPQVKTTGWPIAEFDRFILSKLEGAGLAPAAPADKRTLLRRATFDLVGLPPTPAEVDTFLADDSPRSFEKVIDRLLDSPHYGERWARHWLDLVRYAETCGHEFDFDLPYAFEYRDYVIRALNADVPYNQFVIEQIAGDLLPVPRLHPTERFNESLIGTGFWYLGEASHSPVDIRADEAARADNQIDVFGKTFLAQTLGCARCHDHKFDAISTKDYYALSGYLQSSRYHVACADHPGEREEVIRKLENLRREALECERLVASDGAQPAATRLADFLLASLAVLHPGADVRPEPRSEEIEAAARQARLDAAELARWVAYLQGPARKSATDPFHLWSALAACPGNLTGDVFSGLLRGQNAVVATQTREAVADARYQVFEDFSNADYIGWFITGEAFGAGPVECSPVLHGRPFSRSIQSLLTGRAAHSGALSQRLEGALRSRTFTIEKNRVLYHAAGKGSKINLIIDNFQMIRNPIYGGLTIALDGPDQTQWHVQDVSKWVGHNAYIELIDPGEGFLAIDRILLSDDGPPPPPANAVSQQLLAERDLGMPADLARVYSALAARAIEQSADAKHDGAGDVDRAARRALRQVLLSNDIAGTLPITRGASRPDLAKRLAEIGQSKQRLESEIHYTRRVMAMTDGTPEDDRVHVRGSAHKFGDVVPRRLTEALGGPDQPVPATGSGRLDLARRMLDSAGPVLARVIVNRIWQHHFGEGLAATPDDFGNMGQPPTHPELLDALTADFIRNGWSLKKLHRELMLSRTYQMSSRDLEEGKAAEIDPQNRLLHRMPLRRLEAEAVRDAVLAVSGRLDRKMYGRSVMPYLSAFMIGRGRPGDSGPLDGDGRRTIYLGVRRNFLTPMLLAFDYPIPFSTIGRRSVSNVPAQALSLMNNPFVVQQAEVWARRIVAENADSHDRVARMYVTAFGRPPTNAEIQDAEAFVHSQSEQYPSGDQFHPWADLAHVLFNVKEFIFIE